MVEISPALSVDPFAEGAPSTYLGNLSLGYGDHHHLQIVRKLPDAGNTVVWVIGLDSPRPFPRGPCREPAARHRLHRVTAHRVMLCRVTIR